MNKKCTDCNNLITDAHPNRKRCPDCATTLRKITNKKYTSIWKKANPQKVKQMNRAWVNNFPLKKRLIHARSIARRRNHECDLTDSQFIMYWNLPCNYCGISILNQKGIGLDRLNNDLGYTVENVVPCCGNCNTVRSDVLTHQEMKVAMNAVIEYRRSHA